jgi:spermidine/putrescine ABC transporter ATP-binding subunit
MTQALLAIEGVAKRFGSVTAIDGLTLNVGKSEFFALLGPSGCGKTTLLRIVAGFESPDRGKVVLDGEDITNASPNRRPINLMFQSYALFPHMSVFGNVAYGLEMEGLRGAELKRRVMEMLDLVRMTEVAQRKPHQLSGGQRQRVALARALVKRPKVLLLDEPLGALDRKLREQMQIELKRLQQDTGIAFVVVTHDQEEALTLADRIALLRDGRIVQIGGPRELYDRPVNRFAADFIGLMNFIDGLVVAEGFEIQGLGRLPLGAPPAKQGPAVMAVRPERIQMSPQPIEGGLSGVVEGAAFLGQDVIAHIAIAALPRPLIVRLPAGHALSSGLARGVTAHCFWPRESSWLLYE